ncbi:MAG TPA: hypothetical protein VNF45_06505, partial [Candidatus Binataceae bacterium]|nr:hypothetical protein [Candidatus Binataceae bacterium]
AIKLGGVLENWGDYRGYASNSFTAASLNSLSEGFRPKPAQCPHIDGIGRSSAFASLPCLYCASDEPRTDEHVLQAGFKADLRN